MEETKAVRPLSVCVFCGASPGDDPVYLEIAYQVGEMLGRRRHRLVYGAGGTGVMGAVARGAAEHGAPITGVIPSFLREREMSVEAPAQEMVLTKDLFERKQRMIGMADGFIVLPGGFGTLDELLEVVSMRALGVCAQPIVLVNPGSFWNPFVDLLKHLVKRGFAPSGDSFVLADGPLDAVRHLEQRNA
ncbi:LOG family protein [Amycolatopsis silviterrae]|uniref:Cytokinin riboside 5'-monophosphate phosphoribohydrolase n=1 Tax=Amycolatopsis silviterrae TaxID=1656914 RepID=A0ABW5H4T9_9PSEU